MVGRGVDALIGLGADQCQRTTALAAKNFAVAQYVGAECAVTRELKRRGLVPVPRATVPIVGSEIDRSGERSALSPGDGLSAIAEGQRGAGGGERSATVSAPRGFGMTRITKRSSVRYISHKPDQRPLVTRIHDLRQRGNALVFPDLHPAAPEGWVVNYRRRYRLYRNDVLSLRLERPRCDVNAANRERLPAPLAANEMWSTDFVSDALFDGGRLRALTVVDASLPKRWPSTSTRGAKAGRGAVIARIWSIRGVPKTTRVDKWAGVNLEGT